MIGAFKRWKGYLLLPLLAVTVWGSSSYDDFCTSYNLLTTIAGKGGDGDGDFSEWKPEYEGGKAVDAVLSRPHIAIADSAGNIFIADKNAHAIRKVDLKGIITTVAGTGSPGDGSDGPAVEQALNGPNGLWVNTKGEFYLLDLNNSKIRKVAADGMMTTLIHDTDGIVLGRGLWLSSNEDTLWYSSGWQVKRWTRASGITIYAEGFNALGNITRDRNGFIVATDRGANLVYRIDAQGNKTVIAGNGKIEGNGDGLPALSTALYGVRGVWYLEDNTCFLATHEGSQIWYIDGEGIAHVFLHGMEGDRYHSGDGEYFKTQGAKISEARAVTVDYQGNVLVTENDRGFIRKIDKKDVAVFLKPGQPLHRSIKMYSDPVAGTVQLICATTYRERYMVTVVDQLGKSFPVAMHYARTPGMHEIILKTGTLPCGMFFVTLHSGGESVTLPWLQLR